MKGLTELDAHSGNTMEEDQYCFLFAVRDLVIEMRDSMTRIHGKSPEGVCRVLNLIEEEVVRLSEHL